MEPGKIVVVGSDPMSRIPDLGKLASKASVVKPLDLSAPVIQGTLTPSHAKKVRFGDGKVVELNRATRRRMKLYNRNMRLVRA